MIKPSVKSTTGKFTSWGLLKSYRKYSGDNVVPETFANTTESIRAIGTTIDGYKPSINSLTAYLFGKVGLTMISYMRFFNPWHWAKRGKLEMGETVEEIFEGECEVFGYNPDKSETRFLKRAKDDTSVALHSINYHAVYKVTVFWQKLKAAFLSLTGLEQYVNTKVASTARWANIDEFMAIKYLLGQLLLQGKIKTVTIPVIDKTTANDVITQVAELTNMFQFPSESYTIAGNTNTTPVDDLMILESAKANAQIKVNALATAFNVDYVKFMGNVTMFDSLGTLNLDRLDAIFADDPEYVRPTEEELAKLDTVQLIAMDKKFLQIYDVMEEMADPLINGEGLFKNIFYHVIQILSASPFYNVIAYTTASSAVTGVSIVAKQVTVTKGGTYQLEATVETEGFANSDVTWSVTGGVKGTWISDGGVLRVASNETAKTITVKVASVEDPTKFDTNQITIFGN